VSMVGPPKTDCPRVREKVIWESLYPILGSIRPHGLVTRQISIVAAALAIIVDRSGSGCASRSAIICASMNSPVNPSNAHRRKRATYSGVGFVKGQGHHFLLVTNETRAEPLRTAALR